VSECIMATNSKSRVPWSILKSGCKFMCFSNNLSYILNFLLRCKAFIIGCTVANVSTNKKYMYTSNTCENNNSASLKVLYQTFKSLHINMLKVGIILFHQKSVYTFSSYGGCVFIVYFWILVFFNTLSINI